MFAFPASKARAELLRLKDESTLASKLEATETLVRQQADEKKELLQLVAYYKSLLEAAGMLPPDGQSDQAGVTQKQVLFLWFRF